MPQAGGVNDQTVAFFVAGFIACALLACGSGRPIAGQPQDTPQRILPLVDGGSLSDALTSPQAFRRPQDIVAFTESYKDNGQTAVDLVDTAGHVIATEMWMWVADLSFSCDPFTLQWAGDSFTSIAHVVLKGTASMTAPPGSQSFFKEWPFDAGGGMPLEFSITGNINWTGQRPAIVASATWVEPKCSGAAGVAAAICEAVNGAANRYIAAKLQP